MIVIADSSALIALETCSALDILVALHDDIYVPPAVYREVTYPSKPHANNLRAFLQNRVVDVDKSQVIIAVGGLGEGELEAMALYQQLAANRLLIDDRRARRVAEANGIQCIGALGLLLLAKHQNHIPSIVPYIVRLRDSSLYYSESLLRKVLELSGEPS